MGIAIILAIGVPALIVWVWATWRMFVPRRERAAPATGTITLTGSGAINVDIGSRVAGAGGRVYRITTLRYDWNIRAGMHVEADIVEVDPTRRERLRAWLNRRRNR